MLCLRIFSPTDTDIILGWINNECEFRIWSADRFDGPPLSPDDMFAHYDECCKSGVFFPLTAIDEKITSLDTLYSGTQILTKQLQESALLLLTTLFAISEQEEKCSVLLKIMPSVISEQKSYLWVSLKTILPHVNVIKLSVFLNLRS